jgi:hypothetical protein
MNNTVVIDWNSAQRLSTNGFENTYPELCEELNEILKFRGT